jgi:hypothetical protein
MSSIRDVARETVAKFGLHWGAVDIILSNYSGKPYVLEINSAPCLTDDKSDTIDKYVEMASGLVGLTGPLERTKKPVPIVIDKKAQVKALLQRMK